MVIFCALLVIAALVAYYVLSDRYTPFTTDAYVQAYVVQVAPRVEGEIVRVSVVEDQHVRKGDLLFEIDPRPFEYRAALLEAKLVQATQQVAEIESEVAASEAEDARLLAQERYARVVHDQERAIYQQRATTERKYLDAVQRYQSAKAERERGQAITRKAREMLAARIGGQHALVAEIAAQLANAKLDLNWTRVYAPSDGLITDLQLRVGAYAHTGQAVMTLIDSGRWLVVANFRENAMFLIRVGQPARVAFRGAPGHLFEARVVSVGRGVSQGQGMPSGQLPDVKAPANWVPAAQRFQVRLTLDDPQSVPLRVGMTGSVAVYTRPEGTLNEITRFWHHVIAWLYLL
ncbi:MAG TPA: HlyD family secretion protein [Terriglobales bacterium]|nr:HlyD family secretion protein [Terriglobales bacterium]